MLKVISCSTRNAVVTCNYNTKLNLSIKKEIKSNLEFLQGYYQIEVCSTLHLGIDIMMAAATKDCNIPYHVILASIDQDRMWDDYNKENFNYLLKSAASISYAKKDVYEIGCIERQRLLVIEWFLESPDRVLFILKKRFENGKRFQDELIELVRPEQIITIKI